MTRLRRLAITDTLLVTLSSAVVFLTFFPADVPRQKFQVRHADATAQEYSLPLGDPMLIDLRRHFGETAQDHLPPANLAIAEWTRELADFYGHACDSEAAAAAGQGSDPDPVITVSFDPVSPPGHPVVSDPARAAYWVSVRNNAQLAIANIERTLETRRSEPPAVVFGDVVEAPRSLTKWIFAFAAGMFVALGYAVWRRHSPPLGFDTTGPRAELARLFLTTLPQAATSSSQRGDEDFSVEPDCGVIEIPARWIRIQQPIAVIVRRLSLLGIVLWGLACVALGW